MSREEWWFDFVEDEVDPDTRIQMRHLLKHSFKDQELVQSIADTKTMIQQTDDLDSRLSEKGLDDLHDRIMASLETKEIKEEPKFRLRSEHQKLVKTLTLSAAVLGVAITLVHVISNKSLNTQWDVSQQMVINSQEKPDELSVMMGYQNEHDFFVDVATLSLDHLTQEQFEILLNPHRTR